MGLLRGAVLFVLSAFAAIVGLLRGVRSFRAAQAQAAQPRREPKAWLLEKAKTAAATLVLVGLFGFLVIASGVVPNEASSGHWAITEWLLTFATRRTVVFHSLGIEPPRHLGDPALVLRGAGHYDTGCTPCHGSPAIPQPRIAGAMTPDPPYLPPIVPDWSDAQLFTIVKHGIKFAGMPAWPALERDDEVWAMVAFLRKLPALDRAAYRALVDGPAAGSGEPVALGDLLGKHELPAAVAQSCARCHGREGEGASAFPRLAGQRAVYLAASLAAYAEGTRHSGIMQPVAAGLSEEQIAALARYYAEAAPRPATPAAKHAAAAARGAVIASEGIPAQRIPPCADCHGPLPEGGVAFERNQHYPILAGQHPDYLVLQLDLFARGKRGGTAYGHLMNHVAGDLTPEQMHDVAAYYGSLAGGLTR
ncbi:c-type cytochrome [Vulgatibacter sp.]|uniref:c-type cytochrome n=1 Tax=Vulgatibacter sp. TaxID=1971226 RepID=UPI003564112A